MTLVATTSLVTIVLLVTGWGSAVAAQVTSVLVTNTASQPVPVQAVGTVPVDEQGTASVNVTNTSVPVHEQGTATVRAADNPAFTPFTAQVGTGSGESSFFSVPQGKRLVIQAVAGSAGVVASDTESHAANFYLAVGGAANQNYWFGADGVVHVHPYVTQSVFSEPTTIYADGGASILATAFSSEGTTTSYEVTISGYLFTP